MRLNGDLDQYPRELDRYLPTHHIHVWRVFLERPGIQDDPLWQMLDQAERQEAENYRFEHDRQRFIRLHGILRTILSDYLSTPPGKIRFGIGEHGKPFLHNDKHIHLEFNLTHSEGLALIALAKDISIGIDIEYCRDFPEINQVTDTFFTQLERDSLAKASQDRKLGNFYKIWTFKEANLKARGLGLTEPLRQYEPQLIDHQSGVVTDIKSCQKHDSIWSYYFITPAPGFISTLVAQDQNHHLTIRDWPPD
jgi:4'-phosphopantetheinyl transferase